MYKLLKFLGTTAIAAAFSVSAYAAWPEKPIRLVIGWAAGGAPDLFARVYAEQLSKNLGVPVVIENRTGAAGNISADVVAKAPADGYTFLYAISNQFVTNPFLYEKLPFNPERDFVPIAPVIAQGLFLVTSPDFPAKTLPELVGLAKVQPGKIAYASYGAGGFPHLMMELLLDREKAVMTHVPYRTSAITDIIGGQVPMVIEPAATAVNFTKSGKVRAVAFTGPKRHSALPDVPTFSESFPGLELTAFHGIWAPSATPRAIVQRLNRELAAISRLPEVQKKVRELNCEPMEATTDEMASMIKRDADTWSQLIRSKSIKLD